MNLQTVSKPGPLLSSKLEEALDLTVNEFSGLNEDQQYRNSFARLLKWDPMGRVTMLGTDQRDQMLPELARQISELNNRATGQHIFDVGCGDGQTFMLVADEAPANTSLSILDPNAYYVERYQSAIKQTGNIDIADAWAVPMDDHSPAADSYDLVLCIHSLYFFGDLEKTLTELYQSLTPGGSIFIVFADESRSYTGHCIRHYYQSSGNHQALAAHEKICNERLALLLGTETEAPRIEASLNDGFSDYACTVNGTLQATRLFGHSFQDILSMCNLTELSSISDAEKFHVCRRMIDDTPEIVGLRIEDNGTRTGMISVLQQQAVISISKSPR